MKDVIPSSHRGCELINRIGPELEREFFKEKEPIALPVLKRSECGKIYYHNCIHFSV